MKPTREQAKIVIPHLHNLNAFVVFFHDEKDYVMYREKVRGEMLDGYPSAVCCARRSNDGWKVYVEILINLKGINKGRLFPTLAHEAIHMVQFINEFYDVSGDENDAYLLGHIIHTCINKLPSLKKFSTI